MENYAEAEGGQHEYRSPFGDTTYTKVFVGGLAWETPTDKLRSYFDQFGEILEAVIICDKHTGKSKGYGFVTFKDPAGASRACENANPIIDGRKANCNIASFGRPRPSPPRGRNIRGMGQEQSSSSSSGVPLQQQTTLPQPFYYHPYGFSPYASYAYQGHVYNPQQVQQSQYYTAAQLYGGGSVPSASPYYYGYQTPGVGAGAGYSSPTILPNSNRMLAGSSNYGYYPTQMESYSPTYPNPNSPSFPPPHSATAIITSRQHQHQPPSSSSTGGEAKRPESKSMETDAVVIPTTDDTSS